MGMNLPNIHVIQPLQESRMYKMAGSGGFPHLIHRRENLGRLDSRKLSFIREVHFSFDEQCSKTFLGFLLPLCARIRTHVINVHISDLREASRSLPHLNLVTIGGQRSVMTRQRMIWEEISNALCMPMS